MLPELFLRRMKERLADEYDAFCESLNQERYQALRFNPLKRNLNGQSAVEMSPLPMPGRSMGEQVPWEENGYYFDADVRPGKHPYHAAGVYYIQEPSAMMPVSLLKVKPGERVLDLCAAPGGKSTQIAGALGGQGLLISNEIHPQRAKILSENIERMGVVNACVTNETPKRLAGFFPDYFDKILVDAPCSGEGMFRKNEEAQTEWSPENVKLCAARQDEIMDEAAKMLRLAGTLVYSTCTFADEENEGTVARFLERHPEFELLEMKRLWPHKVKGEGHFGAVLRKSGEEDSGYRSMPVNGLQSALSEAEKRNKLGDFFLFQEENLVETQFSSLMFFGERLYRIPEEMPSINGLKVLRPGLELGTLKKGRFEPSHSLAQALAPRQSKHVLELSSEDAEIFQYLNGQSFPAQGEKGWYLVCVDGFGTGWGKLAGGMLKNHYPKGLRANLD